MNSKKAQSEIITTVLIILLVLAAIVIVWMVVQGTLKGTSKQIDTGAACIGIETTVLSAKSSATLGSCTGAKDATGTDLSPQPTTQTGCASAPTAGTWVPGTGDAKVVVQRNAASSNYNVKALVYIDGQASGSGTLDSNYLDALESQEVSILRDTPSTTVNLNEPGTPKHKVKAVTVLVDKNDATNTAVCPTSQEVEAS